MIRLVPDWAVHYDDFWSAISVRNLWLIKLRYLAVCFLISFLIVGDFILDFQFEHAQSLAILIISFIILLYNIIIHSTRKYVGCVPGKFNCLHLSLMQMILDIIALMAVVYFTGTIESPLHMLFIFHMIIGSLILPGYIVYFLAGVISVIYSALALSQYYNLVDKWIITGLVEGGSSHSILYVLYVITVFSFMLFISVYLANKIARQLYQREQQLRATLLQLDEAERAKQKYTIGVVHEIKTPVNAVHSILDLILGGFVGEISEPVKQKISRARIRTEEAVQLINDVLRISKLKLLNIRASEKVNISELIRNLLEKYEDQFLSSRINIIFSDKRSNKKDLTADPLLLELAFSNLLGNSFKFVGEQGTIAVHLHDENDDKILIEISDNGIGIPDQDIDMVFDQFYRASNIKRNILEGSGVGLTIVKEIVNRHGGSISVKSPSRLASNDKPGTSFLIELPYEQGNQTETQEINLTNY